jgi:hypothetical protein
MCKQLDELKEQGLGVKVSHRRPIVAVMEEDGYQALIKSEGTRHDLDELRGEHSDVDEVAPFVFLPKGGRTVVTILDSEGATLAQAEALCSVRDNYSRKLGLNIALGRAKKGMMQHA